MKRIKKDFNKAQKQTNNKNTLKERGILMRGNPKLIEALNALLADELTAINQYIVHAEMCEDWGYGKLHEGFEKRSIQEMIHAEKLIGRILFLGGKPIVTQLNKINIGEDVPQQLKMTMQQRKAQSKLIMML